MPCALSRSSDTDLSLLSELDPGVQMAAIKSWL